MQNLRIMVIGHIDHGKSTLIARLLYETNSLPQKITDKLKKAEIDAGKQQFAFVKDQLKEELTNGTTIDTNHVQLKTSKRNYTLIDTPGHKEFLKNMLTGTTKADAAILVIDASQGLSEQTYQHIFLIDMLGIKQIIVIINKIELTNYNRITFWELSGQITDYLNKLQLKIIDVIPASAQHGDNITTKSTRTKWNTSTTLIESINSLSKPANLSLLPLRFIVQRPFTTNNKSAILGKVASGKLFKNHHLTFGPDHNTTKVLSITISNQEITSAGAGQSVAILLKDSANIQTGQVGFNVCHPPITTDYLNAKVFYLGTKPLKRTDKIDILCGTQRCSAQIENISDIIDPVTLKVACHNPAQLNDSQVANVILRLDSTICIDPFEKIPELGKIVIIRNGIVSGGGIIK